MVFCHMLHLWYTSITYWPTGFTYGTQLSPTGSLAIPLVLYYHLLCHWLYFWYFTITSWPNGYAYSILLSHPGSIAILMILYHYHLAHWLYLWYSTINYYHLLATGFTNGALLSSTGPPGYTLLSPTCQYAILWYSTITYCVTGYTYDA